MPTAKSLGGPNPGNEGSNREMSHAERAIVNPRPLRLEGLLGPGVKATGLTLIERVRIGGVTKVTVLAKISALTGTPTMQVFGMTSTATKDDADSAERNTRVGTIVSPLVVAVNTHDDFVPAGEEFIEIEIFTGTGLTIDWVEVMGQ